MKKLYSYLALIPLVILSLFPPIDLGINVPFTTDSLWNWLFLLFAFAGVSVLFYKVNVFIKAISALSLVNCFFSKTPFISQFAYMEIVACLYFYLLCLKIEDWRPVKKALWIILGINLFLLLMQFVRKDSVLNFSFEKAICFGSVGNGMQLKSMIIICLAFLTALYKPRISKWFLVGLGIVCVVYFFQHRVFQAFLIARGPAWAESIQFGIKYFFKGWGIGSYKVIFHNLAYGYCTGEGKWFMAHNDFIQVFFEAGFIGFSVMAAYFINLIYRARGVLLFSLLLLIFDMNVHFPMRQTQCVLIMIMMLAYYEKQLTKEGV